VNGWRKAPRKSREKFRRRPRPLSNRVLLVSAVVVVTGSGLASAPEASASPLPSAQPANSNKAAIAGTVLNSTGKGLANLRVTITAVTSPYGPLYGSVQFAVATDNIGHFTIARPPATLRALSWKAEAVFPWYGGSWDRYLTTVSDQSPAHLVFRSDLTSGRAG
jgi:hypothetical protein